MATLSRRLVAGALSGALLMSAVFFTNAAPCAFAEQEKQPRVPVSYTHLTLPTN